MQLILVNFRKEILPFITKASRTKDTDDTSEDCSDVLVVSDSMAIAAHNEDANEALAGHTYLFFFFFFHMPCLSSLKTGIIVTFDSFYTT